MHGVNAVNGQDAATTIRQVFGTMGIGTIFYLCRRTTGTLVAGMVVHGLWDFALVIHSGPGAELNQATSGALAFSVIELLAVVVLLAGVRRLWGRPTRRERPADSGLA